MKTSGGAVARRLPEQAGSDEHQNRARDVQVHPHCVENCRNSGDNASVWRGDGALHKVTGDVSSFTPRKQRVPAGPRAWSLHEAAILRTVLYSSLFEYPLTLDELRRSLLQCAQSEADILRTYAASPRLQQSIELRDGVFFPKGRSAWLGQRRRREVRSLAFLRRHEPLLRVIAALPFVRLVALSGSLAVLNADRRADLDLFVITKGRHAWMTTLLVVTLSKLVGRRRIVCLNFVMSDERMTVEQTDLFTANQMIHLRPVAGRETYDAFLRANPFVLRFYPNFDPAAVESPLAIRMSATAERIKRAAEALLGGPSRALEAASRACYGRYLRWRAVSWVSPEQVRLSPSCLKLHTRSHRKSILDRFDTICREAFDSWRAAESEERQQEERIAL